MSTLPSRLRRLDDALADLRLDEAMLLTELDGFLAGVVVSPDPVLPGEWLPVVWGADAAGGPPFDDPADMRWLTDALTARHDEIARDLGRGRLQPIFDIDERNGDVLWELWIEGFARAMDLRPDRWTPTAIGGDPEAAAALSYLDMLVAIARDESTLDSVEINAIQDAVPDGIALNVARLHAARLRSGGPAPVAPVVRAKVGRNDPCPCGSGLKSKRCCG